MKKNKKINEEFRNLKPKDGIVDDFLDFALPIAALTKEEYNEYKRKVKSGEIKIDNQL